MVRRNETVGNRRPLCVYNNMHAGTEVGGGKPVGLGGTRPEAVNLAYNTKEKRSKSSKVFNQ